MTPQYQTYCGVISSRFVLLALLLGLLQACDNNKTDNLPFLSMDEEYDIDILETSDLCFGSTYNVLYTVSDNTAKVYKITTSGRVLSALNYTGNDLEGVCFVDGQNIYVAEERLREIVKLDLQGNIISKKEITVEKNIENEGLEGISYAEFNQHFYILNEMNPGLLIETDKNLNVLNNYSLSFANDYSGICVDNMNRQLWILSDLSGTINKCNLQGELIESYRIPVTNPEGIAYNPTDSTVYIVSDSKSKLYKFKINNQFTETK